MFLRPLPRLITILGVLAICLGATTESCSIRDALNGDGNAEPSFATQLELQNANGETTDTFDRNELITLELTVRNRLDTATEAQFTTRRTFDFVVVRENSGDVVWKWSTGQTFDAVATTIEFEAGETQTFRFVWNQVGNNGFPLIPGTYEARGVLFYPGFDSDPLESNQMGSELVKFTIR